MIEMALLCASTTLSGSTSPPVSHPFEESKKSSERGNHPAKPESGGREGRARFPSKPTGKIIVMVRIRKSTQVPHLPASFRLSKRNKALSQNLIKDALSLGMKI